MIEKPVLYCWCGSEMRSTQGIEGVWGHVDKRRPGDTHPASTKRPPKRKKRVDTRSSRV